ncbi:hypothetical protein [Curtobacterium sp. SL109]|uniref:hypothetical protein n=1 Tax=Curtobacterium sp. SL109 TaxID=2994662 RepID=UPI002276EB3F|nr:hypothetical protein [Curtobacterium sp. SL109]MCY1694666.1 hypothetical protein [Curtobacterium sp. SL109]
MTETDRTFLMKAYNRALERGDHDDDVATVAQFLDHEGEPDAPILSQAMRAAGVYFGRVAGVNP